MRARIYIAVWDDETQSVWVWYKKRGKTYIENTLKGFHELVGEEIMDGEGFKIYTKLRW